MVVLTVTIPKTSGFKLLQTVEQNAISLRFSVATPIKTSTHLLAFRYAAGSNDRQELLRELINSGYLALDMTDDEMAKLHSA